MNNPPPSSLTNVIQGGPPPVNVATQNPAGFVAPPYPPPPIPGPPTAVLGAPPTVPQCLPPATFIPTGVPPPNILKTVPPPSLPLGVQPPAISQGHVLPQVMQTGVHTQVQLQYAHPPVAVISGTVPVGHPSTYGLHQQAIASQPMSYPPPAVPPTQILPPPTAGFPSQQVIYSNNSLYSTTNVQPWQGQYVVNQQKPDQDQHNKESDRSSSGRSKGDGDRERGESRLHSDRRRRSRSRSPSRSGSRRNREAGNHTDSKHRKHRKHRSSKHRKDRSPSGSPQRARRKSLDRNRGRSPRSPSGSSPRARRRSRSPEKNQGRSPRSPSGSPARARRRSRSHDRKRGRSPRSPSGSPPRARHRSRSPERKRGRSPRSPPGSPARVRCRSRSPDRKRGRSPRSPSGSPTRAKRRSRSPDRKLGKSPRSLSGSPARARRRSRSPDRKRGRSARSPSGSPARANRRSRSHERKRGRSPRSPQVSPPRARGRSRSPHRIQGESPRTKPKSPQSERGRSPIDRSSTHSGRTHQKQSQSPRGKSPANVSPGRSKQAYQKQSQSPRRRSPSEKSEKRKQSRSPEKRSGRRRSPEQTGRSSPKRTSRIDRLPQRKASDHASQISSTDRSRKGRSPSQVASGKASSLNKDRAKPRVRSPRRSPQRNTTKWNEIEERLAEASKLTSLSSKIDVNPEAEEEISEPPWTQCSPKENCFSSNPNDQVNGSTMAATDRMKKILAKFQKVVERGAVERAKMPTVELPDVKLHWHVHKDEASGSGSGSSSSSESESSEDEHDHNHSHRKHDMLARLKAKMKHPHRWAENLWFNDPGELNDAPVCSCSYRAKQTGIRHNVYPGEVSQPACDPYTNNASRLHHYRITVSPFTNFLTNQPTVIEYDEREYMFEGFSMFTHYPLTGFPECKVVRFNIEYTIHFLAEPMPENFTVKGLDHFADFLFEEILELYDFELKDTKGNGCRHFHFMPRFARKLPNNGKEILSMHHVIQYLIRMNKPIIRPDKLDEWLKCDPITWSNFAGEIKNMIATCPGKKPSSVRIDQLDREVDKNNPRESPYPVIVHFGVKPPQLTYAGDIEYQKLFKSCLKMKHLLANKPTVTREDKEKLHEKESKLLAIRYCGAINREVTAEIDSKGVFITGIRSDICQHAMMLPVLANHVRYFSCLHNLEKIIGYSFKEKMLLKHAMTHPSYRLTYGMNADHVRNSLFNCGMRAPDYGDRKVQYQHSRKKGINTLIRVMSRMAAESELPSHIHHYERLEFLGDAVVEFVTSTHLYHLFPDVEEGGLATYRQALVQNQHLAVLAKKLELDQYLLYAHGPDLCRGSDLRHAMANCFEALMGALYLEAGLEEVKRLFCKLVFEEDEMQRIWLKHPAHPLQTEYPNGDREMIEKSDALQKLGKFEDMTGIRFRHIRLLARAFTQRTVGYTNLTRGHNQRMEFLGDSVLQLITSTYLYKFFPDHHEGHLSLLRSCLVNNRTQATVAQDLGMVEFIIDGGNRTKNSTKQLADLLEAFLGALYVDSGLEFCQVFCDVCFFPRLEMFIREQEWNDAKSQLQQCVLTLRSVDKEPEVPYYKVIGHSGPANTRRYTVAVYFQNERLGKGQAASVQDAQMEAAKDALQRRYFPQFKFQQQMLNKMKSEYRGKDNPNDADKNDTSKDTKDKEQSQQSDTRNRQDGSRERTREPSKLGERDRGARGGARGRSDRVGTNRTRLDERRNDRGIGTNSDRNRTHGRNSPDGRDRRKDGTKDRGRDGSQNLRLDRKDQGKERKDQNRDTDTGGKQGKDTKGIDTGPKHDKRSDGSSGKKERRDGRSGPIPGSKTNTSVLDRRQEKDRSRSRSNSKSESRSYNDRNTDSRRNKRIRSRERRDRVNRETKRPRSRSRQRDRASDKPSGSATVKTSDNPSGSVTVTASDNPSGSVTVTASDKPSGSVTVTASDSNSTKSTNIEKEHSKEQDGEKCTDTAPDSGGHDSLEEGELSS